MTAGREDGTAGALGQLRTSHADREAAIDMLKAAFIQGRLTKDEFDLRVGQVFASRTYADLGALTADIPGWVTSAQPSAEHAREPGRVLSFKTAAWWEQVIGDTYVSFGVVVMALAARFTPRHGGSPRRPHHHHSALPRGQRHPGSHLQHRPHSVAHRLTSRPVKLPASHHKIDVHPLPGAGEPSPRP